MKKSETGLLFDWHHRRTNALRRSLYEHKKAEIRRLTDGWPEVQPEGLTEPAAWWWRALDALRQEHRRATYGLALIASLRTPRRAGPKIAVLQPKRKAQ